MKKINCLKAWLLDTYWSAKSNSRIENKMEESQNLLEKFLNHLFLHQDQIFYEKKSWNQSPVLRKTNLYPL